MKISIVHSTWDTKTNKGNVSLEALFQPNSATSRKEDITVDGTTLNSVREFLYLGSTLIVDGCIEAEKQKRMSKASMSFGQEKLQNNYRTTTRFCSEQKGKSTEWS